MIYIAKMHTRYPDYHGSGYYNFLMNEDEDRLNELVDEYSHDFSHEKTVKTRFENVENLVKAYPTKQQLNAALFEG